MRTIHTKIFTLLIIGTVIFAGTAVFAAKNYNSSKSNSTTIAIVNQQVGDILLRYGVGGAEINIVTEALAVGISEVDLKAILIKVGIGEEGVSAVFTKLDKLGTGFDSPEVEFTTREAISTSDTGDATQEVDKASPKLYQAINPVSDTGDTQKEIDEASLQLDKKTVPASNETERIEIKAGDDDITVVRKTPGRTRYQNITLKRAVFHDTTMNIIQNIRSATSEEREILINELQASRKTFQTEIVSMNLSIRDNAKELRDNFRERVETVIGHVDHGKTARIAVAHGKGLRMINRFRSATARFDHILDRLESRVDKLAARFQVDSFFDVETSIEEAKNISVENEAKLEQLKAKYESLLEGENPRGVAEEAREIATELKTEIENLHAKLREITDGIKQASKDFNSSKSNTSI